MRRALGIVAVILACVAWNAAVAHAESISGKVTSVSSGHIMQVEHDGKREIVVMLGISSPDSKTPEGKLAKAFVANRALEQTVKVDVAKRSDRVVTGTVFLPDGTELAQLVLSEGMGSWNRMTAPDNTRYRDLEAGAKLQKLGMWGADGGDAVTTAPAVPGKPAGRVESSQPAKAKAEKQESEDGKKPKLVLRGDADVAEAARAEFEKEQQTAAEDAVRQAAEQERQAADEQRRQIEQQKRDEAAAAKAGQDVVINQAVPEQVDVAQPVTAPDE